MDGKRITKTKRSIKQAFLELLQEVPFEAMTVAEICRRADVSRITFYTHYGDKTALAADLFADYRAVASETYYQLQAQNNPDNDDAIGYRNLFDAILELFIKYRSVFQKVNPNENPYLYTMYAKDIMEMIQQYMLGIKSTHTRFPEAQTAAFVCSGMAGVLLRCMQQGMNQEETQELMRQMFNCILTSSLFEKD